MEGALGRGSRLSLTRGRGKRSWFLTNITRVTGWSRGARQRASEVVRQLGVLVDNAKPGRRHRKVALGTPPAERRGEP
jgi:hypothetical protein